MKCVEIEKLLSPFHDGELSEEVRASVDAHLDDCTDCAQTIAAMRSMSHLVAHSPVPDAPDELWTSLEEQLDSTEAMTPARLPVYRHILRLNTALVAALVLVAVGVGIRVFRGFHVHEHTMNHAAMDFERYWSAFRMGSDQGQRLLASQFETRLVDVADVEERLQYRPVVANGPPPGFQLDATYLVKMPCCTCVETVCRGENGQMLLVLEHTAEQAVCFGNRSAVSCPCGGKQTQMIQLENALAATWPVGNRSVTVIGVQDMDQLAEVVRHFDREAGQSGSDRVGS